MNGQFCGLKNSKKVKTGKQHSEEENIMEEILSYEDFKEELKQRNTGTGRRL